jgi:hypothetical protein
MRAAAGHFRERRDTMMSRPRLAGFFPPRRAGAARTKPSS